MFGLSTIKARNARAATAVKTEDGTHIPGFGRVGGEHQKKRGPVVTTVAEARAVVMREPLDPRNHPFKPVTLQELLDWVKKSKVKHYRYINGSKCGCLMTQHLLDTRYVREDIVVGSAGRIGDGFFWQQTPVYPFHDEFWEPFLAGHGYNISITKAQAIARLKEMIAEKKTN